MSEQKFSAEELETTTGGRPATGAVIPGEVALSIGNPNTPTPEGWNWVRLTDVARLETGHTPSRGIPEYWGGDVPWVGVRDATENHGRTIFGTRQYTNLKGIANSSARILPANTVCLSRTASVGYVVVMGVPMATSQDFVNWVCSENLDHRYLKYLLLADTEAIRRFSYGTTHQTVYFPEVKAFHALLPPLAIQKSIADTLSSLDDKIELNRQMNQTLEEMARAIFRSWFVDFDPVRIKARGGDPTAELGLSPEIAVLFPDSFQDSELGHIPSGWQDRELGDSIELAYGKALRADVRVDGSIPVFGSNGQVGVHSEPLTSGPNVIVGRKGNPGFVTWCSDSCFVIDTAFFVVDRIGYPMSFWWLVLDGLKLQSQSGDSAVPGLSRAIAYRQKHVLPPGPVAEAWAKLVAPLRAAIDANIRENLTLAETRDYLIPLLLSGKIEVLQGGHVSAQVDSGALTSSEVKDHRTTKLATNQEPTVG